MGKLDQETLSVMVQMCRQLGIPMTPDGLRDTWKRVTMFNWIRYNYRRKYGREPEDPDHY